MQYYKHKKIYLESFYWLFNTCWFIESIRVDGDLKNIKIEGTEITSFHHLQTISETKGDFRALKTNQFDKVYCML